MIATTWLIALDRTGFLVWQYLLSIFWQSSVLFAGVLVLAWALRRTRPAVRHAAWVAALALAPALPLLTSLAREAGAPQAEVAILPAYAPAAGVPHESAAVGADRDLGASRSPAPAARISTTAPPHDPPRLRRPHPFDYPWALAAAIYAIGAGALLVRLASAWGRLRRMTRAATPVSDARTQAAFARARAALALRRALPVLECAGLPAPLSLGVGRARVLLPPRLAARLSDADLDAVALHETAHVRRGDPLTLSLAAFMRAALFFHPMAWLAAREIAALAEQCADDAVLEATAAPIPYAKLLARLAESVSGRPLPAVTAAGLALRKSAFLRRVEAILAPRRTMSRGAQRLALATAAAMLVLSACLAATLPLGGRQADLPPAYEKAEGCDDLKAKIGPNEFAIRYILRNDREGALHPLVIRPIAGRRGAWEPEDQQIARVPWMDLVNIHYASAPGSHDVIELRVFDHATRALLGSSSRAGGIGYGLIRPGVIQLRSTVQKLPDTVDIWMRVNSYEPGDSVLRLAPKPEATVAIGGGTLTLRDIRDGMFGFRNGFQPPARDVGHVTSAAFAFEGTWNVGRYQICAVGKDGAKSFPSAPHFIDFSHMASPEVVYFNLPLDEIDHFEIRLFGGRHRFFFEGVQLPKTSETPLASPPPVTFRVDGREGRWATEALAPLRIELQVLPGAYNEGSSAGDGGPRIRWNERVAGSENKTTIAYRVEGLVPDAIVVRVLDRAGNPLEKDQNRGGASASSNSIMVGSRLLHAPLAEVGGVVLALGPKAETDRP